MSDIVRVADKIACGSAATIDPRTGGNTPCFKAEPARNRDRTTRQTGDRVLIFDVIAITDQSFITDVDLRFGAAGLHRRIDADRNGRIRQDIAAVLQIGHNDLLRLDIGCDLNTRSVALATTTAFGGSRFLRLAVRSAVLLFHRRPFGRELLGHRWQRRAERYAAEQSEFEKRVLHHDAPYP